MSIDRESLNKGFLILSWGLYDMANQFFALNIVSLYFVRWLTLEKKAPEIFYSISFGVSMFFIAIMAPVLGTVSDILNRRRPFLIYLTFLSIVFTMILGISDNILVGLFFFAVANFGCQTAIVFYNALMVNITPRGKVGLVSGFGKMLGYTGALLALYLIKPIVLKSGYQATFLPTGILFFVFALPCLLFVKDKGEKRNVDLISFFKGRKIIEIFKSLKAVGFNSQMLPGLPDFLKASFFGLCAVNVIILFMSVYATRVFGLDEVQIINLIAFSTLFAILGSILSGYISDRVGARLTLITVYLLWVVVFILGASVRSESLYLLVGALVGMVLGATWVVSRALAIELVPVARIGEVFGLFNLVGYLSGIVGALFWGLMLLFLAPLAATGYRIALLSLNLFILLGSFFLLRIPKVSRELPHRL